MIAAEALEAINRVGLVEIYGENLRLRFPEAERAALQTAIATLRRCKAEAIELLARVESTGIKSAAKRRAEDKGPDKSPRSPEPDASALILKGHAVELWCDHAGGRIFVVADDEDAQEAIRRFGTQRGEVWTPGEIELVAYLQDQAIRDEVARFKRQMDGGLRPEFPSPNCRLSLELPVGRSPAESR